jgi:hypothetical protein
MINFPLQDVFGTSLAFFAYPLMLVFPGYVAGRLLNLFGFRQHSFWGQLAIAVALSFAVSPIVVFLASYYLSTSFAIAILLLTMIVAFVLAVQDWKDFRKTSPLSSSPETIKYRKIALMVGLLWAILCILFSVDWQLGDRLYNTVQSYDYTTRVAVVNAITRTGVPPTNPSYYPGHPVKLTFLYYFWYVLSSVADILGGNWITAYQATLAGAAWCGLGLMAVVALYLTLRNPKSVLHPWKVALVGIGLLSVTGFDIIPIGVLLARSLAGIINFQFAGDMEHWNEQITAWVGSVLWVPNHVAAMLACVVGMLLLHFALGKGAREQLTAMIFAGLAFASALGLSVWVTASFALCWGIWLLVALYQKAYRLSGFMLLAGLVALVAGSPFILGVLTGGSPSPAGVAPVVLQVRPLSLTEGYLVGLPGVLKTLAEFLLLPLNYLLELGLFFFTGMFWLAIYRRRWRDNPFYLSEMILLGVVLLIGSLFRSNTTTGNDLGWRCWLLGQFVLLVWAVDVIIQVFFRNHLPADSRWISLSEIRKYKVLLAFLFFIGLSTTFADLFFLRATPILQDTALGEILASTPHADRQLGARTFAARLAYQYISEYTPVNAVVQSNPTDFLSRPVGLYGTRQMSISSHTPFGVPDSVYNTLITQVAKIFNQKSAADWSSVDATCRDQSIDLIVINDTDPIWASLDILKSQRPPLYQNAYYALFSCADTSK